MKFTESLEVHYPTYVLQRDFSGLSDLHKSLYKNILALEQQFADKNAVKSGQITTEGGFQTPLDFNYFQQNDSVVNRFKTEILFPAINSYLSQVFGEESKKINPWPVGWANILRNKNWQRPHFHPTVKNIASGVYYLKIPKDAKSPEGDIEFINPVPISINHGYSNTRRITPVEGKLILFPPYYMHYVHPSSSNEDRVVIAFDVLSESPGFQFVY
ncbi:putative 2OG-Fe(II) oxygenase [Kangiella sp. HZ709]|uniref:putative 2OG-Fe(II) oxygenase n=1 Tax=Kangiella sp. HZ709 TaxID=2666328 RepID=UPI0012AEE19F|nr:putative 2OG-Fe(II) oxygenase [Kangiella sp. HZ709]MRX28245.1 hypothetical protein [Kangiella sp. HZ709]